MRFFKFSLLSLFIMTFSVFAQEEVSEEVVKGHTNENKFKQLKDEFATPNAYHLASGAPGPMYTQQQVDYKMDVVLNDKTQRLDGQESIVYYKYSNDTLTYLWVQLDQNMRAPDSKTTAIKGGGPDLLYSPSKFTKSFMGKPFQGGFNIDYIKDQNGNAIDYTINNTMMRVDLPKPLASGEKFVFQIKWWYNINDYTTQRGRSGYEPFPDGNRLYVIAQFFPRLAVYNNVEGWQNMQFWGSSEFALEFGNYEVSITTPKDHTLNGTGVIQNPKDVFTKKQYRKFGCWTN